jgi:hypothetical protein
LIRTDWQATESGGSPSLRSCPILTKMGQFRESDARPSQRWFSCNFVVSHLFKKAYGQNSSMAEEGKNEKLVARRPMGQIFLFLSGKALKIANVMFFAI